MKYRNTFSYFYRKATVAMPEENKKKTSIAVDPKLWTEWIQFVVAKTGSARKLSDEIEKALKYYMAHAPRKS